MKINFNSKKVVTKCDIKIELENDREILAMKNICQAVENNCHSPILDPRQCKEELEIIKYIRKAINKI